MKRLIILYTASLVALTAIVVSGHALAEASCDTWNSLAFFKKAGIDEVERCLISGADPNTRVEGGASFGKNVTVLHAATVFTTDSSVIELMLAFGADPLSRTEKGLTPIYLASLNPTVGIVEAPSRRRCRF